MILITGSSGFLGRHIAQMLSVDYQIKTLNTSSGDYHVRLENEIPLFNESFSLVIHAAGRAHVIPKTDEERRYFYDVNVTGTQNLLSGLEKVTPPERFVFISSVAVYGMVSGCDITENMPLLAKDPYGRSKIDAESLVLKWCEKYGVQCTILRLPLVAGVNPPANLGNMINAIRAGYYFNIDGGKARKSIVMADDVAKYIISASKAGGIYNLTDGEHPSFKEISSLIAKQLKRRYQWGMPYFVAKMLAICGDAIGTKFPLDSQKLRKIISPLTFNDQKARERFGWQPQPVLVVFKISENAR